jgi:hypothetical protein
MRRIVLLSLLALLLPLSAKSQQQTVDLELVLLSDASGSIDQAEIAFQREGYAAAVTDPEVLNAMTGGWYGSVAIAFVEWGDFLHQDVVVPWAVIAGPADAQAFATALRAAPRRAFGSNAIGNALQKAYDLIEGNDIRGLRRVIDFSGDSAYNFNGLDIEPVRTQIIAAGITINGLAILCRAEACSGRPVSYDLERAFEDLITGGPGNFVVKADSRETFAAAVKRKLILEIAGSRPSTLASRDGVTSGIRR